MSSPTVSARRRQVLVGQCGVKHGGVVGVQGHIQPCVDQTRQRMSADACRDSETDIAGWADLQRDLALAQFGYERGIFDAAYPMADPHGAERSQRAPDALWADSLASVRHTGQPGGAGAVES